MISSHIMTNNRSRFLVRKAVLYSNPQFQSLFSLADIQQNRYLSLYSEVHKRLEVSFTFLAARLLLHLQNFTEKELVVAPMQERWGPFVRCPMIILCDHFIPAKRNYWSRNNIKTITFSVDKSASVGNKQTAADSYKYCWTLEQVE